MAIPARKCPRMGPFRITRTSHALELDVLTRKPFLNMSHQELITTECEATFPETLLICIFYIYINVTMSRLTVVY
jgi:hypothetical protein